VAEQLPEVEILLKRLSSLEAQIVRLQAEVADLQAETARLQAGDTPEAQRGAICWKEHEEAVPPQERRQPALPPLH